MTTITAAPTTARHLVRHWQNWWAETETAPDRMPNSLHARTALFLCTPEYADPVELLREWFVWWATSNTAPPEMPGALNARTSSFLAKLAIVELQETGMLGDRIGVCPLCFTVSTCLDDNRGEFCRRCVNAHTGTVIALDETP
ncbi:hypothetical protein [Actinomadura sp. 9N215]|uniref:hypothetical protein n=1 Tax=Actinomadura sp. 9N215 TaxID=3375150 RepID=UPI0037B1A919